MGFDVPDQDVQGSLAHARDVLSRLRSACQYANDEQAALLNSCALSVSSQIEWVLFAARTGAERASLRECTHHLALSLDTAQRVLDQLRTLSCPAS